jgi:hypothetical protein
VLAPHHAHGGAASQEVLHHLPGDVARIGGHAACREAVVTRADQHLGLAQLGRFAAQDQAQLQRQRLQSAQRAQGLSLAVDLVLQPGSEFEPVDIFDVHVSGKR